MKVVWICHFNNMYIEQKLRVKSGFEFAPWISNFISILKNSDDLEIHIVAPHRSVKKYQYFEEDNIHYHFFSYKVIPGKMALSWMFHYNTNFFYTKFWIKKIVDKIQPDLIHLFGFENPHYSSGILQFKGKYPILITVQGFASRTMNKLNKHLKKKISIEQQIIKEFGYFGVRDYEMKDFISFLNPKAIFFWHEIAVHKPKYIADRESEKQYDIVHFTRICKNKGIENLIQALAILKKDRRDISTCIMGPVSKTYFQYLENMISHYNLDDNIKFLGALATLDDVHKVAVTAKICVLPTWSDTIPGTIIESIFMKIPCISYAIGGIPSLNEQYETIKLVEKGDIDGLTKNILFLLDNPDYAYAMAERAYEYVNKRWRDEKIYKQVLEIYHQITSRT